MLAPACQKETAGLDQPCEREGLILAADYRKCMCCSGWFIKVGGDTLRTMVLPEAFISENAGSLLNMPNPNQINLPVTLTFRPDTSLCYRAGWDELILVDCIKKRED